MEEAIKVILSRLDSISEGVASIRSGQAEMRNDTSTLSTRQAEMRSDISTFSTRQAELRNDISTLSSEQAEMRKEAAFYYSSMMKKLDENHTELSIEIKQITFVQKQHQDVLEIINKKQ